jgi:predicted AAA+ superfamily ATPase
VSGRPFCYNIAVSFLPDARIDAVLRAQNPWWVTGTLPRRMGHTLPRPQDATLVENERPVLLVGPRRGGKTATLLRLLDARLRAGARPRDLAYVPLDHTLLRVTDLGAVVDRALQLMEPEGRPLVLLDALQALSDWPRRFLEVVETRPRPRIVAAAAVAPGAEETAYDRVYLPPLTFREFSELRGVADLGAPPLDLFQPELPAGSQPEEDYLFDRILDPLLADYLVRGGFPAPAFEPDLAVGLQSVRDDVVARAIYQDLPGVVGVVKIGDLERVLLATQLHGVGPLTVEAFADALELAPQTVGRFLDHLARAFLVTTLKNFAAVTDRSRARVFPTDPSLPNALLERGVDVMGRTEERRALLVSTIVSHVELVARERGFDTAYFREGDLEAEIVAVRPEGVVPIVVVDREDVDEQDAARAERVMKRLQASSCLLLSRARPRRRKSVSFFESVYHLPAAYFLYALRA